MTQDSRLKTNYHQLKTKSLKLKTLCCLFLLATLSKADEGMWLPQLIEAMNFADMKKNGFKLSAEQIYSVNKASMKDAVAVFGGGCTSEVISTNGLILTNHHCGYGAIAALSTVDKDYLKNGFFAMNANEEIYCKGLTVTFIKRIDDVTSKILLNIKANFSEAQKDSTIQANIKTVESQAKSNTQYDYFVRGFYYGNEFYLFTTEVFKDIRLVAAPPESIGKFGGETDNWVWPRHNADFSMFRIYANQKNQPSEFGADNVPYKPAYSFPISLKGAEKGDFTMVYGFPGRTQEYLTSYAVNLLVQQQDPLRVRLREKRLAIMEEDMKKNDTIRLMYANRYAGVANAYKKWSGEMQGLMKSNAVVSKQNFESSFLKLIASNSSKKEKVNILFKNFEKTYSDYGPISKQYDYYSECLMGIDGIRMVASYSNLITELRKKQSGKENKFAQLLKESIPTIPFKNYNKETDRKLFRSMMEIYAKEVDIKLMPTYLDSILKSFAYDVKKFENYVYDNSALIDNTKAKAQLSNFEENVSTIEKDPMYQLANAISAYYQKNITPQVTNYERQIAALQKEYMASLKENIKTKLFYPDANGTLRVAYGKVSDYDGKDGIHYYHYTTMDGLIEKNKTGAEDFYVKEKLIDLYNKKDYGQYADKNGKLRTAFIASNHTTGGNSGSPVLNANGELIGTNFDRNWEGTMSDVMYNVNFCRNISLDVRYTLWVIDKFAGAGYLLNEMKIVK